LQGEIQDSEELALLAKSPNAAGGALSDEVKTKRVINVPRLIRE